MGNNQYEPRISCGLPLGKRTYTPRHACTHAKQIESLGQENAALRKRVELADEALRQAQERAEKAEQERDELMDAHQALGREYEMQGRKLDALQADLDAALRILRRILPTVCGSQLGVEIGVFLAGREARHGK